MRAERALADSSLASTVPIRATFELHTSAIGTYFDSISCEERKNTMLVHCGWNPGAEALEKRMHLRKWAGVAISLNPHKGITNRVYCYLPLPISSGLPVSINASWALSSNRQSIWTSQEDCVDEFSCAADMAEWNRLLLTDTLSTLYAEIMEILTQVSPSLGQAYAAWPDSSQCATQFLPLVDSLLKTIYSTQLKVLWHPVKNLWIPLSKICVETPHSRINCHSSLRKLLEDNNKIVLEVPSGVLTSLAHANISVPFATPDFVSNIIRSSCNSLTFSEAEQLICFVLSGNETNSSLLNGLKCVPLVQGNLGTFSSADCEQKYYICSIKNILPGFTLLLEPDSPAFQYLTSTHCLRCSNIELLSLDVIAQHFSYILPNVARHPCIALPGEKQLGMYSDLEIASSLSHEINSSDWKTYQGSKRKPSKNKKYSSEPVIECSAIRENLLRFWTYVSENNSYNVQEALSGWPTIYTTEGFLLSIPRAKERVVLLPSLFSGQEYEVLRSWGCLFTLPASASVSNFMTKIVGVSHKSDALRALAASYDPLHPPTLQAIDAVRTLVLEWRKTIPIESEFISKLPLFKTLDGKATTLIERGVFASPTSDDDPFSPSSFWDSALRALFADRLLSLESAEMRELMKLANHPRVAEREFLSHFLYLHLQNIPSLQVCLALLKAVVRAAPWKNPMKTTQLLEPLKKLPLIMFPDGTRLQCKDIYDPADKLLQEICGATLTYPPNCYRDPDILKVLRHAGMRNLANADCFIMAAKECATQNAVVLATELCKFLVSVHSKQKILLWPQNVYHTLGEIQFVPTLALTSFMLPPLEAMPLPSAVCITKSSAPPKPYRKDKKKTTSTYLATYQEEEEQAECDLLADCGEDTSLLDTAISTTTATKEANLLLQKGRLARAFIGEAPAFKLARFNQSVTTDAAWVSWTTRLVVPSFFNSAALFLLDGLSIAHLPTLTTVCEHLANVIAMWTSTPIDSRCNEEFISAMQVIYIVVFRHITFPGRYSTLLQLY